MSQVKKICKRIFQAGSLAITISLVLFFIPFFWNKPGFIDLGGDAGRLYFLDPLSTALSIYTNQTPLGTFNYAMVPYEYSLYLLKAFITSPTILIAIDHGMQLSLGFLSIYLIMKELTEVRERQKRKGFNSWVAILGGIVYVGLVTKIGWSAAMHTQNQVFLNPLIFYLLLRFLLTSRYVYACIVLLLTLLYSGNFGHNNMPQILSFYPIGLLFLLALFKYVYQKPFPIKKLLIVGLLFMGLHSFHIIPTIANVLDSGGIINTGIFSQESHRSIINYFDVIRQEYGKLSLELFQPANWNGKTIGVVFIPLLMFLGFIKGRSKLLAILGIFFSLTFFLVTANITLSGVRLYRQLFNIPGFMMFRSFYEKWYFVYAFFYTLLFAASFFQLFAKKRIVYAIIFGFLVVASIGYRIYPFLLGRDVNITYTQSNIAATFTLDPDLTEALNFVKGLPHDGKILTLPLTFPYYQVFFGREGGAYIGISAVSSIGGKKDYSGFWSFGPYHDALTDALRAGNEKNVMQILSFMNIRYIFRNTDERVLTAFPKYPFYKFDTSVDIPVINTQASYDEFLRLFPLSTRFEKGFFRISQFDDSVVRPLFYIPDSFHASQSSAIEGASFRSAYGDEKLCMVINGCDTFVSKVPEITVSRISPLTFTLSMDIGETKKPFLIVFSEDFHPSWTFTINGKNNQKGIDHIQINGYANAWIIDPVKAGLSGEIMGTVYLGFQKYFFIGRAISFGTGIILGGIVLVILIKKYVKKRKA